MSDQWYGGQHHQAQQSSPYGYDQQQQQQPEAYQQNYSAYPPHLPDAEAQARAFHPQQQQYAHNSYESPGQGYGYSGNAVDPPAYGQHAPGHWDHTQQAASNTMSASNSYSSPPVAQNAQYYEEYHYAQSHETQSARPPQPDYATGAMPPEHERGIAGALAGGAMGAYGGHQLNHGVIGAIGGAIAGSKLEDHYKDENKKKKSDKKKKEHSVFGWTRRHSNSSSSSSSSSDDGHGKVAPVAVPVQHHQSAHHQEPVLAGNFSASCASITLDHDYDLIALCRGVDGQQKLSSISLNSVLTNSNGHFQWARGGNFGASARDVRLIDGGKVLEAELGVGGNGGWNRTTIRLDERITNENGELKFLD